MSETCPACFMANKLATKAGAFCAGVAVAMLDVPPDAYCDEHLLLVVANYQTLALQLARQTDWSAELKDAQESLQRARAKLRELPS